MKRRILLLAILKLSCGGSASSNAEPSEREVVESQCKELCQTYAQETAELVCKSDEPGCIRFCESDDAYPNPCLQEALDELGCRLDAGAMYSCGDPGTGTVSAILNGGEEECEPQREAFLGCECANYCECNSDGQCLPP